MDSSPTAAVLLGCCRPGASAASCSTLAQGRTLNWLAGSCWNGMRLQESVHTYYCDRNVLCIVTSVDGGLTPNMHTYSHRTRTPPTRCVRVCAMCNRESLDVNADNRLPASHRLFFLIDALMLSAIPVYIFSQVPFVYASLPFVACSFPSSLCLVGARSPCLSRRCLPDFHSAHSRCTP
jgi:hypothetical protein